MVSAAWKSRGGLDDRLYIAPHFHKPPEQEALMKQVGGKGVSKKKKLNNKGGGRVGESDSALPDSLDPPEKQLRVTIGGVMQGVGGVPIVTEYEVPPVDPGTSEFELLKRKYVYPFNTPANPKFNNHSEANDVDEAAARARRLAEANDDGSDAGDGGVNGHAYNRDPQQSDAEQLGHEIATPLEVSVKQIELIQKRFLNTFPFDRLQHKMQSGELDTLNQLIVSPNMKRLIGLTAHFLYFTSFQKFSGARGDVLPEKRRRETYTAIVQCFSEVELSVRRARCGDRMLVMALVLLSLRMAIESIFRNHFPTWFTFESFVQANFWSGNRTQTAKTKKEDASTPANAKTGLTGAAKKRLDEAKRRSRVDNMVFGDDNSGGPSISPFKVGKSAGQSAMDPRRIEVILETLHVGPLGATLTVMNTVITDIFDAKRYYGRISALESTGEGIRILSQANLLRSRTAARPTVSENFPGADLGKDPAARMAEDVAAERARKRRGREMRRKQQQRSSIEGGRTNYSNAGRYSEGKRSSSPPTSPDMMEGGRFHSHVQEMDELRIKQVGSRSSSETMAAGYATSGLVKSVFSSPSAPRARQILYRGGKNVGGRTTTTSEMTRQLERRNTGPPSPPGDKQVSWRHPNRSALRRRPTTTVSKGGHAGAARAKLRKKTRPSSRPALTAAGKTALHKIAIGKVRERYSRGVQNGVATSRMRVLDDLVL